MKTFPAVILILSMVLPSCVVAPFVMPTKNGYIASAGGVLAARRKNTVTEVTAPGIHIKTMSEEESGEDVPNNLIAGATTKHLANVQGRTTDLKTVTDSRTALGLDRGRTARAGIAAGVRGAEVLNPNIPLPIRR
jgi:hypothetical protein